MSLAPLQASYEQAKTHMDNESGKVAAAVKVNCKLVGFHVLAWLQAATTRILVGGMLRLGRDLYDEDDTDVSVN